MKSISVKQDNEVIYSEVFTNDITGLSRIIFY